MPYKLIHVYGVAHMREPIYTLEGDVARAIEVIRAEQKASVSLLQRKMPAGYARAYRAIEFLESSGIIGPAIGTEPRALHLEKYDDLQSKMQFFRSKAVPDSISSALPSESFTPEAHHSPLTPDSDVKAAAPATSADVSLKDGWRNGDAALENGMLAPSAAAETKRVIPDATTAVEKGPQSIAGSSPAPSTTSAVAPIKLCVMAYLPPIRGGRFHTLAFLENLKRNPPAHDLIMFSDTPDFGPNYPTPTLRLKRSIEVPDLAEIKDQHSGAHFGFANLAFFLAWGFAWKLGYTHFCYLEADCRMKSLEIQTSATTKVPFTWDEFLLSQFIDAQNERTVPLIVGGSTILWNPFNADRITAQRASDLMAKWNSNIGSSDVRDRNRYLPCYGAKGQADGSGAGVSCNGAGAIYSVEGLKAIFPQLTDPDDNRHKIALARDSRQFDFEIGKRLWHLHKADSFNYVAHLPAMFSSFGNVLSTEDERLTMLRSGQVVLVHQVKGNVIE